MNSIHNFTSAWNLSFDNAYTDVPFSLACGQNNSFIFKFAHTSPFLALIAEDHV